jgi:hypothetical protein
MILTGETEVLGEKLRRWHSFHHKSHCDWPGIEPRPPPELWHGLGDE